MLPHSLQTPDTDCAISGLAYSVKPNVQNGGRNHFLQYTENLPNPPAKEMYFGRMPTDAERWRFLGVRKRKSAGLGIGSTGLSSAVSDFAVSVIGDSAQCCCPCLRYDHHM